MKKLWFVLVFLEAMAMLKGQDAQFSQFYSNYLYLAPSFAGLTDRNRFAFNYRDQWPQIGHGFKTYSVSFDKYLEKYKSGLGVLFFQDMAGTGNLRTTNVGIQYSFDFNITQSWHMRPGLHFNYTQRGIDFERLLWNDQISASGNSATTAETPPMDKAGDVDLSLSMLTYSDKYWLGACVDHLLKPNQSLYYYEEETGNPGKIPVRYSVFGGVKFLRNENLLRPIPTSLQLAFLYMEQKQFRQLDLGVYWFHSPFVVGFWYRGIPLYKEVFNRDAFTVLFGIKWNSMNIGYSYDFTISRLVASTGGSHEISLSYTFKLKPIKRKPGAVPCPEF